MLALVLASVLAAPVAEPVEPPTVGILPVRGGTGLGEADREHLRARSRATLLGPWVRVVDDEAVAAAKDCEDHACRQRSLAAHGVSYWLTTEIDGRDRMYAVRTALYSVDDAAALAHTEERCVVCGRVELAELVAAQTLAMRSFLTAAGDDPSAVVVDARPRTARVEVDGAVVGKGRATAEVKPGEHRIRVSARGYTPQELTLAVTHGVTRSVEVHLTRPDVPGRLHRPLAIGALVVAAAGIGTGVGLIATDGDPIARQCGPDDPQNLDADGDCRYVKRTMEVGVVATALGAGLASAAATLLVVDAKRRRRHAEAWAGTMRLHVGPGRVGISGKF